MLQQAWHHLLCFGSGTSPPVVVAYLLDLLLGASPVPRLSHKFDYCFSRKLEHAIYLKM